MKTGIEGIELIKYFEGCKLEAYLCPANVWTIGYGHTSGVKPGDVITPDEADALLAKDLEEFEGYVDRMVTYELNQNQFDSLVSWTFNLGPSNLGKSTLLRKLNAGEIEEVPAQIKRWNRAGGKVLAGLTRRREAEARLFEGDDWRQAIKL